MTKQIAKVFYDKEVSILVKTTTIDAEGGVNAKGYDVIDTFKGNVNFSCINGYINGKRIIVKGDRDSRGVRA